MLLQIITAISDFLWGTPMTVALVGTGLYLGIRFGFRYNFRKVRFNFRNTFGKMFRKGEGAGNGNTAVFRQHSGKHDAHGHSFRNIVEGYGQNQHGAFF